MDNPARKSEPLMATNGKPRGPKDNPSTPPRITNGNHTNEVFALGGNSEFLSAGVSHMSVLFRKALPSAANIGPKSNFAKANVGIAINDSHA